MVITPLPGPHDASGDEGAIAYQVLSDGLPLVSITSWHINVDVMWEEPCLARSFQHLASFSRAICFGELVDRYGQHWG